MNVTVRVAGRGHLAPRVLHRALRRSLLQAQDPRVAVVRLFRRHGVDEVELLEVLAQAKATGFRVVVAAAGGSVSLSDWCPAKRNVLVVGSEAHGVSADIRDSADVTVAIPRYGRAESLNAGVAAAILLAHTR